MARRKDDSALTQLFDGPAGGGRGARSKKDAQRDAARRQVLSILDAVRDPAGEAAPLDDDIVTAYLDSTLSRDERAALEARLAASYALREQVAAAAEIREAGLKGGVSMPPAFIADYDAVPAPVGRASERDVAAKSGGGLSDFFASLMPGRRWVAVAMPALLAVVVVAVLAPDAWWGGPRPDRKTIAQAPTVKDKAARKPDGTRRAEERMARRSGRSKPTFTVMSAAVVPLSSELRTAVVALGRNQYPGAYPSTSGGVRPAAPAPRQAKTPRGGADAEKRRSYKMQGTRRRAPKSEDRPTSLKAQHIATIKKALAPGCPTDPSSCCGNHKVDRRLLGRLVTGTPPLHTVKVLYLSTRTCFLTIP